MQTNLHRVSEFAVAAKQTADDAKLKPEARSAIKRFRDHANDTESEIDDIVCSSNISASLKDPNNLGLAAPDPWHDCSKSEVAELDTTVFLSFDWENEEPYMKAVERYHRFQSLVSASTTVSMVKLFGFFICLLWSSLF